VVAADGDDGPDIVLRRPREGAAQVFEGRVVEVAVAVDDHLFNLNMPCGMLTVVEKISATRAVD
jgi:hypothetical protein